MCGVLDTRRESNINSIFIEIPKRLAGSVKRAPGGIGCFKRGDGAGTSAGESAGEYGSLLYN